MGKKDESSVELEDLVNQLLPFAEHMLNHYGGFYPYGGLLSTTGELQVVHAEEETDQEDQVIDLLLGALRDKAKDGRYMASAIVVDVRVAPPGSSKKTDAIELSLEHAVGPSMNVFVPYTLNNDGRVDFGKTFSNKGPRRIFAGLSEG